ncbi:hypothetical protein D3C87_1789890 [compost metagenome]
MTIKSPSVSHWPSMSLYAGSLFSITAQYPISLSCITRTKPYPFSISDCITCRLGYPSCHCLLPSALRRCIACCNIVQICGASSCCAFLNWYSMYTLFAARKITVYTVLLQAHIHQIMWKYFYLNRFLL